MKLRLLLSIVLAIGLGCHSNQSTSHGDKLPAGLQLRVMTYNIHHAAGEDGKVDVARIAAVIQAQNPDLVALQEVDVNTTRAGRIDEAKEIGRLSGMHAVFGKAINFSDGEFGQAILSKYPIAESKVHMLPGDPAKEQRIALETSITLPQSQATLRFISTHLDHSGGTAGTNERLAQAKKIIEVCASDDQTATILAGDFNAVPESPAIQLIQNHFTNTSGVSAEFTFPSDEPKRKIDWIFVRPAERWKIVRSWVVDEKMGSDHRPVVTEIELIGK